MSTLLDKIDLIGGPCCGILFNMESDKVIPDTEFEVPYYGGIAIYKITTNLKARYIRG